MAKATKKDDAKPRYVVKRVRALQRCWDGIQIREEGEEFDLRIVTHMPARDAWGHVKRDATGKPEMQEIAQPEWCEILGDSTPNDKEWLESVMANPVVLIPPSQWPPEEKVPRVVPMAAASTDGGVL